MRILLICPVFPPEVAPAGVMTRELAEDLAARGHDVTVVTAFPNQPLGRIYEGYHRRLCTSVREGTYRVTRLWHTVPDKTKALSRLLWWASFGLASSLYVLLSPRADVVYCHPMPIIGTLLMYLASRLRGMALLLGIYDVYPETIAEVGLISPRNPLYRIALRLDTWVCRRVEGMLTLSKGLQATLVRRGLDPEKIAVMPFWLDEKELRPLDHNNAWRREQGIDERTFVVLYAGTIGHVSGAAMMARVADRLRDVPDLLFLFVGMGAAKAEVEQLARDLNLPNMRFLPFQPRERLAEVQSAADVGVITLLPGAGKNSLPSKMLGYLACGRAVLASVDPDSDTAACIREAKCGLITPAQDVEATAEAVRKLMEPEVARHFGEASRAYFMRRYARSAATDAHERLLKEVACRWPGRPVRRDGKRISLTPLGREIVLVRRRPLKRLIDFTLALAGLVVSLPALIPAAVAVKLTSRGPVLYRDKRFGQGGKVFPMYKLRSMKTGAPAVRTGDGKIVVDKNDPRVTAVGRVLRRLKVDELPQLLNVLKGDMAMVGPRPHQATREEDYDDLAYEKFRGRPGVTGLATVLGGRHFDVPCLDRIAQRYGERQSLGLDLLIIALTPVYVFLAPGFRAGCCGRSLATSS